MTNKKCQECENETMLKYSDLQIELWELKKYCNLLEHCLDSKDELNKTLRNKAYLLETKLEVWNDR